MFKRIVHKLLDIYKLVLDIQIDENDFLKGNLIKNYSIDSLIALQLIVEVEKSFDLIIEEDELAIELIDSPLVFYQYYQCCQLKTIYESVLNRQIDEGVFQKENLISSMNIDQHLISVIITEIENCFQISLDEPVDAFGIVNAPFSFFYNVREVGM